MMVDFVFAMEPPFGANSTNMPAAVQSDLGKIGNAKGALANRREYDSPTGSGVLNRLSHRLPKTHGIRWRNATDRRSRIRAPVRPSAHRRRHVAVSPPAGSVGPCTKPWVSGPPLRETPAKSAARSILYRAPTR